MEQHHLACIHNAHACMDVCACTCMTHDCHASAHGNMIRVGKEGNDVLAEALIVANWYKSVWTAVIIGGFGVMLLQLYAASVGSVEQGMYR